MINYEQKINDIKKQIDKLRPFDEEQLKSLRNWFMVAFTYHTNSLEWNTLTLSETKVLLEDGITIWWKTLRELEETKNMWELSKQIWDMFVDKIDKQFICDLHKKIVAWTVKEEYTWKFRKMQVFISWEEKDVLPSYKEVDKLIDDYIKFINTCELNLKNIAKIHYDFVKIHPFVDGNWRLARFLMNLYMIKAWYLPIIISSTVRLDYINSLRSDKTFEDFYKFFLWQTYENMKDYKRFFIL